MAHESRVRVPSDLFERSILLAGPTASGKSAVALILAEKLGGEIISVDSMQVYRGMNIGTAKASLAERTRVPHHLVDLLEVNEPFDAAKFVALATQAARKIRSRSRIPIFCGGTGLYFKALLEGLGESPGANARLRAELEAAPISELLDELAVRDPETYQRLDRQNPRRVIRAVEVLRLTGKPISAQRAKWSIAGSTGQTEPPIFAPGRTADDLRFRINSRVDEMFRRGLVRETQQLLERGLAENPTARQALGYRQVVEHLRGERSLDETIELVKIRTRQFAKRQMTWFRHQLAVNWVQVSSAESPEKIASNILALARQFRIPS